MADPVFEAWREVAIFYCGDWKVIVDPDDGTSCECPDHTKWVLDPLRNNRCVHSGLAWRAWLDDHRRANDY